MENNTSAVIGFLKRANVFLCGFNVALVVFWGLIAIIAVAISAGWIASVGNWVSAIILSIPSVGGMIAGVILARKKAERIRAWSTSVSAASFLMLLVFTVVVIPKPDLTSLF